MNINKLLNQIDMDLYSLFSELPGYILIKDLHSMYLGGNVNLVREYGFKKSDDLYGYTDTSIPHPMAEVGSFFGDLDRKLL